MSCVQPGRALKPFAGDFQVLLLLVCWQAYKGLKSILGAVLCSHIDPTTGTNPFFEGMGYVPGSRVQDTAVGPPPATAAQQEEVLSSATIDLPEVLTHAGTAAAAQVGSKGSPGSFVSLRLRGVATQSTLLSLCRLATHGHVILACRRT